MPCGGHVLDWALIQFMVVMAAATLLTRALPFVLLYRAAEHPVMTNISRRLPGLLMLILVIYGLVSLPESEGHSDGLIALALTLTVGCHLAFRQPLISILSGTGFYIMTVQGLWPDSIQRLILSL